MTPRFLVGAPAFASRIEPITARDHRERLTTAAIRLESGPILRVRPILRSVTGLPSVSGYLYSVKRCKELDLASTRLLSPGSLHHDGKVVQETAAPLGQVE